MYSVMLVDDDYPVIELLSEVIDWERLGFQLLGVHENGQSAWEHAEWEMPDVLITDIGMPKMNGLELIGRIKERKANVRVAILSCHDEFQYAQQAMRMNVQEYLLKDALNPADLERLLAQFRQSLDEERQMHLQQTQLKHLVNETKELRKEQWLKNLIQQPLLSPQQWVREARELGILREGEACIPVIGFIDAYRQAKQRFLSDQTLRFAIDNLLEEVVQSLAIDAFHADYGMKETFLLFSFGPSLKVNMVDRIAESLKQVQIALGQTLRLQMSFIMAASCSSLDELKRELTDLTRSAAQRFYLEAGEVVKREEAEKPGDDLFSHYDQASVDFREVLLRKDADAVGPVIERWASFIRSRKYAPETVKDLALKLLLDLKLKLQSMQFIRPGFSADTLHQEIAGLDSLHQLQMWMTEHLKSLVLLAGVGAGASMRQEVKAACKYVSLHLEKRISLEEVAEHLFLSPSYFSRLFKKETGENFIEYVTRMKMERAKELLDQTDHTVGKICEMLGYDNQSYFIKIFKTHTGVTPVEYRG